MGNTFGNIFKITTFGESHGQAIGVVIDGVPAGLFLCENDFLDDMVRRRPGQSRHTSPRQEEDAVRIMSGVFEGVTLGTPIMLLIENNDAISSDYDALKNIFRQGHGDYTYMAKYGVRDHRGGGRASGRETAARVAAGVIAKKIIAQIGITITSHAIFCEEKLKDAIKKDDSIGSVVKCSIQGLKPGIGQPVFDKLEAKLAHAIMSIGGARAFEIGQGVNTANLHASEHNPIDTGILAGISDGDTIEMAVTFKAPPTVKLGGRHDPVLAPRASPVVEAMTAIVLVDYVFVNFSSTMETVIKNY